MSRFSHPNPGPAGADPTVIPRWKRALDVSVIVLSLPLVLPLAVGIVVLIRLVSPGPLLFRQERVGHRGRKFECLKFRTMVAGAETANHQEHLRHLIRTHAPMVKLDAHGDARIIPGGVWLRASGLDELPQLINVLLGDMSVVGPRPCLAYECENYELWQRERFNTLPGLTGLWQVSGKNRVSYFEMMQLDVRYARNKTLRLDLVIILKTLPAILIEVWYSRKKKRIAAAGTSFPGTGTIRYQDNPTLKEQIH